jgi:hypothetical protein
MIGILGLGFVLGLRHALDVDHLAAVSTIVSQRRSLWSSSVVGAIWGLGHTASLLAVGLLVIGLHAEVPPRLGELLELGVAAMLVGLGANLLWSLRHVARVHAHSHAGHQHAVRSSRRPFLIGLVHGLAGSAGLMLAVLATIPSRPLALAYVAVFGSGSVGGMMVMSALLGLPMAVATERFVRAERTLKACAALGSVGVGLLLAWEVGKTLSI